MVNSGNYIKMEKNQPYVEQTGENLSAALWEWRGRRTDRKDK